MQGQDVDGQAIPPHQARESIHATLDIRILEYWLAVATAAFIIPAASGLWAGDADGLTIMGVAMGVVSLGYILFGILHHPAIAFVGLGIAASFYLSVHLAGDAWPLSSALLMPAVVLLAWMWVRKSEMA